MHKRQQAHCVYKEQRQAYTEPTACSAIGRTSLHMRPLPRDEERERETLPVTASKGAVVEFATGLCAVWDEHAHDGSVRAGVADALVQMHKVLGASREPRRVWAKFGRGDFPFGAL